MPPRALSILEFKKAAREATVAEGEELLTNLFQVSQRNPASSGVLDEVFGTHKPPRASEYAVRPGAPFETVFDEVGYCRTGHHS